MEYLILHMEETRLSVAHFAISRKTAELIGAAEFLLDEEQTLETAVGTIAGKMTGNPRVILCISPMHLAQRRVTLPFADLKKVREILPAHLQGDIAVPVEELVLDALPVADGSFLAVWARKSEVTAAISRFRDAGIEPHVVTSYPLAMAYIPGVPGDSVLCSGFTLAVMRGGRLAYFRTLGTVLTAPVITATLTALEISGEELPQKICLVGSGEGMESSDSLPVPAELVELPAELGALFKNEATFHQLAPLYAVARAAYAGALPDFRRGELAWTAGDAVLRKKLFLTGVLTLIIVILLFVTKGVQYRSAATDVASVNKSIAAVYREIFPARTKAVDEISEVKGEIRKLAGVENSGAFIDVARKLAEAKGSLINGLYEAELEGRTVRIKGDARSAQAVNEFKAALAPLLAASELGEVKSRPDTTVTFSLTGTLKEAGK